MDENIKNTTENESTVIEEINDKTFNKTFCIKCGAELEEEQKFCFKCGHRVGDKNTSEKNVKHIIMGITSFVIVIIVIIFFVRGVQAKTITLNKSTITLKVGETTELTYTINPDNTKNKNVKWVSSNNSIAIVNDGKITGKNEGDCIITVSTKNGKVDTCEITVTPSGPDLLSIFKEYCSSTYADIASDGSYLSIDSNPMDSKYNAYEEDAVQAIITVNKVLGLPDSVLNKIAHTRSIDGRQVYEGDGIEISWIYHPDNGLEITYTIIN